MRSGVDYLGRDMSWPLAGQNGLHKKKCNYFMLVLHAENSLLFQTNSY